VLDRPGPPDRLERGAIGRRDRSLVALRRGDALLAQTSAALARERRRIAREEATSA